MFINYYYYYYIGRWRNSSPDNKTSSLRKPFADVTWYTISWVHAPFTYLQWEAFEAALTETLFLMKVWNLDVWFFIYFKTNVPPVQNTEGSSWSSISSCIIRSICTATVTIVPLNFERDLFVPSKLHSCSFLKDLLCMKDDGAQHTQRFINGAHHRQNTSTGK